MFNLFKKLLSLAVLCQIGMLPAIAVEPRLIDLDRVSPTAKKRLVKTGADQFTSADQFTRSCGETFNPQDFALNHMAFEINMDAQAAWDLYLNSSPQKAWNGKSISLDFAYSKNDQKIYYHDEVIPKIQVGMGFFLVLSLYQLKKIPLALEISKIDPEGKVFEYTYLESNVSHGKQIIHFIDLGNHKTRIEHDTYFKSESALRDRLYPMVHERLLEEFHQNVMNQVGVKSLRVE